MACNHVTCPIWLSPGSYNRRGLRQPLEGRGGWLWGGNSGGWGWWNLEGSQREPPSQKNSHIIPSMGISPEVTLSPPPWVDSNAPVPTIHIQFLTIDIWALSIYCHRNGLSENIYKNNKIQANGPSATNTILVNWPSANNAYLFLKYF